PAPARRGFPNARSTNAAAIQAGQRGGDTAFIAEYQLVGPDIGQLGQIFSSPPLIRLGVPLQRVQSFFYAAAQAAAAHTPPCLGSLESAASASTAVATRPGCGPAVPESRPEVARAPPHPPGSETRAEPAAPAPSSRCAKTAAGPFSQTPRLRKTAAPTPPAFLHPPPRLLATGNAGHPISVLASLPRKISELLHSRTPSARLSIARLIPL